MRLRPQLVLVTVLVFGMFALSLLLTTPSIPVQGSLIASPALSVAVQGNELIDNQGRRIVLHGVSHSGSESLCANYAQTFDGPVDAAAITAMTAWNINAVRVPLNSSCWLGIQGVQQNKDTYQADVLAYVDRLAAAGLYAILDLHCNDLTCRGGDVPNIMATRDDIPFWASVATAVKNKPYVLLDLYNEPHDVSWTTWRNGDGNHAGMQEMLNAVRGTGALNVVMAGGLAWANDLTGWLANKPTDPAGQLVASWHSYNFNACNNTGCWNSQVSPVAAQVPIVAGEIGENDCASTYVQSLMTWLESIQQSYILWTWNTWDCGGGPSLIKDYSGAPTNYGAGVKTHLLAVGCVLGGPTPVPTKVPSTTPVSSATPNPTATPTRTPLPPTPTPVPTGTPTPKPCDVHTYDTSTDTVTVTICPK